MAGAATDGKLSPALPLATLIGRELRGDGSERPLVRYGHSGFAKRGEDYFLVKPDCLRVPGDPSSAFSVFAVFDGHNGVSAAVFSKEKLLEHVMSAVPQGISREDWLQALPRALVAGFVKTDIDFQRKGETSGTTATLVVVDGFTVTVASVGDSRCILDTQGGEVSLLTVDHRLEENVEERERVTASGGEVSRLNLCGGQEVGPLRCWPGGLCLSRSIGDTDVGEFIVPIPHVKQVKLPNTGGRLIIASDGIWDALSSETAAQSCRGLPAELAAKLVVKPFSICGFSVVVDSFPDTLLAECLWLVKLGRNFPSKANLPPFRCAVCQVDQEPFDGLMTDNVGGCCSAPSTPWGGPYLCSDCRKKKDAMEGESTDRKSLVPVHAN
ncbi:putative protein phosphatase 2C 33 [Panicum miliaceum]|uniref:protein-serine/threonine phosphatase n=1 Tax=Panicum miliaceum TaxID=4540 RepID=A0A3L6SEK7_PANMI|nr:putative protein phosphatase 2C 33 [Panicum miliaceum]